MQKVFIIGIDGATWDLLNPAIEKGILPNISNIKENGISTKLKSVLPPATGSAWPSFSTGCYPNKHGIFDFVKIQKNHKTTITTADDIKVPTIFEYLDAIGKISIIINHPLTYGLKLENGMIFADFLSPKPYAYPKREEKYLDDYRLFWNRVRFSKSKPELITQDIIDVEDKRMKLVMKLIKKNWNLFFVLFSGTDWISHLYFSEMAKESMTGEIGFKVFEYIDHALGRIINEIDDDTILIIMSDHGFSSKEYSFNINQWLASQGYLRYIKVRERKKLEGLRELRKNQEKQNNENIPFSFQVKNKVKEITLELLVNLNVMKEYKIDWKKSLAYIPTHNCFGIYMNNDNIEDYDEFANELVVKLKELLHPATGKKVFSLVETIKNIYGRRYENAPDILFLLNDECSHDCITNYTSRQKKMKIFSEITGDDHALYGIFMAYGRQIENNSQLEQISIIDIAPTILELMNYSVPKHIDGKSFSEQIYIGEIKDLQHFRKSNIQTKTDLEKEKIKARLKLLRGKD